MTAEDWFTISWSCVWAGGWAGIFSIAHGNTSGETMAWMFGAAAFVWIVLVVFIKHHRAGEDR